MRPASRVHGAVTRRRWPSAGRPCFHAALCLVALACGETAAPTQAALSLRQVESCDLGALPRLSLTATGDFVPRTVELSLDAPSVLDGMPVETRFVRVEAQAGGQVAGGVVAIGQPEGVATRPVALERDVLLLPLGRSCPLGDPLAAMPSGAAPAALADGTLFLAGGRDRDGNVRSSAVLLAPGEQLVQQVPGGMVLRRVGASASESGLSVVVVGGAADDLGTAHDTFEIYDRAAARFDSTRIGHLAHGSRRDHAALTLADGRVLIAGGRAEADGDPLVSAERLDPATGVADRVGELELARSAPSATSAVGEPRWAAWQLLRLDDGQVLAVGGVDGDGVAVSTVERFEDGRFETVADAPFADDADVQVAVAALPGVRLAWLACWLHPAETAASACRLRLLLLAEHDAVEEVSVPLRGADAAARAFFQSADVAGGIQPADVAGGIEPLWEPQLVALDDGRLLLTARADQRVSVERVAIVVDPSTGAVATREASRVPARLIALSDGSLVELDATGASLRRELLTTPFDDPEPNPLAVGALALDAPAHWSKRGSGLVAEVEGARLDLPHLRYARARVALQLADADADPDGEARPGTGALLLLPDAGPAQRVELTADSVSIGDCAVARAVDDAVEVEWRSPELRLLVGDVTQNCPLASAPPHVRFGLQLSHHSVVEGLHVQRL